MVDLFAGYYVDSAKLADGALDKGKIVSKEYQVKIRNASQTPLELISTKTPCTCFVISGALDFNRPKLKNFDKDIIRSADVLSRLLLGGGLYVVLYI